MMHGGAAIDNCGTCDAVVSNDCEEDCEGVWGGEKIEDCAGVCNGANMWDNCDVCDADPSNDCPADCVGVWGGSAVKDECDICGGDNSTCTDCNNKINGEAYIDGCGTCIGGNTGLDACPTDCAGVDGGTSFIDECDQCVTEGDISCVQGCDGSWKNDGTQLVMDECNVCGGDNSTCSLPPDLFSYNQSMSQAFYVILLSYDYQGVQLTNEDWIGAFNGDVCVGARLWDTSQCSNGVCDVPVMGDNGSVSTEGYMQIDDIPTFKIWDASEQEIHNAVASENHPWENFVFFNISKLEVYTDCFDVIGGPAVIDNCGVCGGDGDCEGIDCTDNPSLYCQDLSVLQILIDNSNETIYMNMDDNGDGIIEPSELGYQTWEDGRLISFYCYLDFFGNTCGLTQAIPPEIGNLTHLTELNLRDNQLTGEIPSEIGNLTNLTKLNLSHTQLTGEIPSEIWNLTNLSELHLSYTQLTGEIPSEIGNLTNLIYLYLYGNELTGGIPPEIGNLTNLTTLYLSGNQLSGEIPSEISNLVNLERLVLSSNPLTGEIPSEIGNLTNLTYLDLGDNQLTGEIPSEIWNLVELTNLNLSNNQLTGEIPSEIENLANLYILDLSENQLSGSPFDILLDLANLNILHLAYNQFSGYIPVTVCESLNWVTTGNNQFCPPYPYCFWNAEYQDISNCP